MCIAYTPDGDKTFSWEERIRYKELMAKFVCLLTRDGDQPWRYNDNVNLDTVDIDNEISKESKKKCLLLDKKSYDELLLDKILKYAVKDDYTRYNMMERYKEWWNLDYAGWMKYATDI